MKMTKHKWFGLTLGIALFLAAFGGGPGGHRHQSGQQGSECDT